MGHGVTVFEAFHKPGGVLVYGIPEFRLPKRIVKSEIEYLEALGVKFVPNTVIGKTITIDELLDEEGFHAVFIGSGAGLPYFMNISGEELPGVYSANEYLTRNNLMEAYRFPESDTPPKPSRKAAVLGGGNVAMDCARTALRLGAEDVYLIYRRSDSNLPARAEEVHHAREEGVVFLTLTNAVEILPGKDGGVRAIRVVKMAPGAPDEVGRERPLPIPGTEYEIEVDTVIEAIGNGPNPLVAATTPGLRTSARGAVIVDEKTCMTSKRGVFAGGDIVSGSATVILAMGQGRRAAKAIDVFLATGER
jgi:glutamate synthase (NADPH/NADH) small chain